MQPYISKFERGSRVRVRPRKALEEFARDWKWHHPLQPFQFDDAGMVFEVETVGFYHGGDVVYTLRGSQGTWHEDCLEGE